MPSLLSVQSPDNETTAKSLTLLAFEALRADIISCHLKPSEKLRIQALAKTYSVGVTAIREALSRLVADGFVEATDQKGFRVAPVSKMELIDLTQTRVDIEKLALAKALQLGDIAWESQVLAAFHQLSRQAGPAEAASEEEQQKWAQLHKAFHETLLSACDSPWLMSICQTLHERSERYRHLSFSVTPASARSTVDEHEQLMNAAIARDTKLACSLLENHLSLTTEILLKSTENSDLMGTGLRVTGTEG